MQAKELVFNLECSREARLYKGDRSKGVGRETARAQLPFPLRFLVNEHTTQHCPNRREDAMNEYKMARKHEGDFCDLTVVCDHRDRRLHETSADQSL